MEKTIKSRPQRTHLYEVDMARAVLVVLLVLYHAFCMYDKKWELCRNATNSEIYQWISRFAYAFLLQGYFFLSGYVWAFQREALNKKESLVVLVKNKSIRLLLPAVSFGFIYYLLFYKGAPISAINNDCQIFDSIMYILNGPGHLWFLPALFWSFIIVFFINNIHCTPTCRLLITLVCAILPYIALPFRLGWAMFYIFFFYLGYFSFIKRDILLKISNKVYLLGGGTLCYCIRFAL